MISIVIPALDEERALPATLTAARIAVPAAQVIVVDGGSRDATREVAAAHPGVQVLIAERGRAAQMNAGARAAWGDWLLFLHADTRLPRGAGLAIESLHADVRAGCFRQAFDRRGRLLDLTSRLHNRRCEATGIMYGDQAPFVRAAEFAAVGGYPAGELEDVRLSERLRERAPPVMLPLTVVTSARRFLAQGEAASLARILLILLQHRLGRRPVAGRRFFEPVR